MQKAVLRLLRYAVSEANIKPEEADKAIDLAIPALRKAPSELSQNDESQLWKSCNSLTSLVQPATCESIWIAEQIEEDKKKRAAGESVGAGSPVAREFRKQVRWIRVYLIAAIALFFFVQAYVSVLSDACKNQYSHPPAIRYGKSSILYTHSRHRKKLTCRNFLE
jgi:hypothetical protein